MTAEHRIFAPPVVRRQLLRLERIGNRLPHPTMLLVYFCGLILLLSALTSWFGWRQLVSITAVKGAEVLQALNPNAAVLLVCFVMLSALINLLVGSASAKWALLAPIFVPMLPLSGISPEAT